MTSQSLIWQIASPKWAFDDATFDRSAAASIIRTTSASRSITIAGASASPEGETKYDELEKQLAKGPVIGVPTINARGRRQRRARIRSRAPTPRNSPANTRTARIAGGNRSQFARRKPRALLPKRHRGRGRIMTVTRLTQERQHRTNRQQERRGFLRQIVTDAAGDRAVRVFAGEFLGVGARLRMRRAVGVALERDGGTPMTGPLASCFSSSSYFVSLRRGRGASDSYGS